MSVCWLRQRGGTLLAEVEKPTVKRAPTWVDNGAGACTIDIPLADPSIATLRHPVPVNGRKWRTVFDTDIEVAWWPEGVVGVEPVGAPIWAGPVLSCEWRLGVLQVGAASQEWYVERGMPFGTLINYMFVADFDTYPDLDYWVLDSGASAVTVGTGPQYTGDRSAVLSGAMATIAGVPLSPNGNYATVGIAVYIPTGSNPYGESGIVGFVTCLAAPEGTTSWVEQPDTWYLEMPSGWEHDQWYVPTVQVSQPAGVEVQYRLEVIAGDGPIRFSRPRLNRPANVGAAAGADIAAVVAAVFEGLVDESGFDGASHTPVGVALAESVRYFLDDREQAGQMLADWTPYLHWWVVENVLYAAPQRGEYRGSVSFTGKTLKDWRLKVDASQSVTEMIGQIEPEGPGASDEVIAATGGPNRLVGVVQVPASVGPSDADTLTQAHLEASEPVVTISGQPALPSGPGDVTDYSVGDWFDVEITDSGETVELQPVVAEMSWHPFTHRVTPTLQLGGQKRPDLVALLSAQLAAAERQRRKRSRIARPALGSVVTNSLSPTFPNPSLDVDANIGPGVWVVTGTQVVGVAGGFDTGGIECTVSASTGASTSPVPAPAERVSPSSAVNSSPLVVRGPATVTATGLWVTGFGGYIDPTPTSQTVSIRAVRVG